MNSQITFSGANGNVKYFEAGQRGQRNLTHAVNKSDWNGLTVKLHAAVVKVKTIFFWCSGNTEKERRQDLRMKGVGCLKYFDTCTGVLLMQVQTRKTCLKILCGLIVCT